MINFLWVLLCILSGRYPRNLIACAVKVPRYLTRRFDFVNIVKGAATGHEAAAVDEARRLSFHLK